MAAHLTDLNPIDSIHLINVDAIYEIKKNEIRSIRDSFITIKQSKAISLAAEINNLPTDFAIYTVLKDFYLIYSKTELSKYSISASDIYTLRHIANLCPLVYGEAVYRSQSYLVSKELNDFDDFQINCQSTIVRNKSNSAIDTESFKIEASPNPTSGVLQIRSTHPIQKVKIRNLQGKVMELKSFAQETKIELDLSRLIPSVYIVDVESINGERAFKKIIRVQ